MNEIASELPGRFRRLLWPALCVLLLLGATAVWWFGGRSDPRFVGNWEHPPDVAAGSLQAFELRGDGTGDLLPAPGKQLPIRWWYDGSSVCFQPGKDSLAGQMIQSFQQRVGMSPDRTMRLYVVQIDEGRFEYIGMGRGLRAPPPGAETRVVNRRRE